MILRASLLLFIAAWAFTFVIWFEFQYFLCWNEWILRCSFDYWTKTRLLSLEIEFEIIQQLSFCNTSTLRKKKRNTCIVHVHFDSLHVDLGKKCISVCSMICVKRWCLSFLSVVRIFKVKRFEKLASHLRLHLGICIIHLVVNLERQTLKRST